MPIARLFPHNSRAGKFARTRVVAGSMFRDIDGWRTVPVGLAVALRAQKYPDGSDIFEVLDADMPPEAPAPGPPPAPMRTDGGVAVPPKASAPPSVPGAPGASDAKPRGKRGDKPAPPPADPSVMSVRDLDRVNEGDLTPEDPALAVSKPDSDAEAAPPAIPGAPPVVPGAPS